MADTALLLVLLTLNLAFVSYLIWARLGWLGASTAKALSTVAELWAVFGIAAAIFAYLSGLLSRAKPAERGEGLSNLAPKPGAVGELADLGQRFAALPLGGQVAVIVGGLVAVGLLAHSLCRLNAAMRAYESRGNPEQATGNGGGR